MTTSEASPVAGVPEHSNLGRVCLVIPARDEASTIAGVMMDLKMRLSPSP
jgi:hypothetical protein